MAELLLPIAFPTATNLALGSQTLFEVNPTPKALTNLPLILFSLDGDPGFKASAYVIIEAPYLKNVFLRKLLLTFTKSLNFF